MNINRIYCLISSGPILQARRILTLNTAKISDFAPPQAKRSDEPTPMEEVEKKTLEENSKKSEEVTLRRSQTPEEGEFTKQMKHVEEEDGSKKRLQNYKLIEDRAERLNLVKEWLLKVRDLKEKTDSNYSDIDFKVISSELIWCTNVLIEAKYCSKL